MRSYAAAIIIAAGALAPSSALGSGQEIDESFVLLPAIQAFAPMMVWSANVGKTPPAGPEDGGGGGAPGCDGTRLGWWWCNPADGYWYRCVLDVDGYGWANSGERCC